MARRWLFALVATVLAHSQSFAGSIIGLDVPIPDSEVILNHNGTGLDWVYAGPTAPNGFGQGIIEAASYRAAEGWRYATAAEWAMRPDWSDFIKSGYTQADVLAGVSHDNYKYTSDYWNSTYSHIDLWDAM